MSAVDLEAIRERLVAATPGPWMYMGEGVEGGSIAGPTGDCYRRSGYSPRDDMILIANAPTDIAALLAEVERLKEYAPSPEMQALLARSSLGTDEAVAARGSVSADAAALVVRLSRIMAERATDADLAGRQSAEIERLNTGWLATEATIAAVREVVRFSTPYPQALHAEARLDEIRDLLGEDGGA